VPENIRPITFPGTIAEVVMKKTLFIVFIAMLFIFPPMADACVGKMLRIGAVGSADGYLLSEMLAIMINERTGSTVNVKFYKNTAELYEAVRSREVDILIENTATAMEILNQSAGANLTKTYETVKSTYEKEKGLIWLKPFGSLSGKEGQAPSYTAPVLKVEVLSNFPALPRVIDKLAGVINDETYARMIKSMNAGEKPKSVARDFLKSKKLI
jgi:osmoprotectant transport system substrate-binding protein